MKVRTWNAATRPLGAAALLLSCAFAPTAAFADATNCSQLNSLPVAITTAGSYCLGGALTTGDSSGPNIDIKANNVVLDCNGNQINFVGESGGVGVRISGKSDIVVRNCHFNNFNTGIDILNGHRILVQGNYADGSKSSGLRVTGSENELADNVITNTVGANGIRVDSNPDSTTLVHNNTVRNVVAPSGGAAAFRVGGGGRVLLRDNVVREIGAPSNSTGTAIVIQSDPALVPSPAVVWEGAAFAGSAVNNYGVSSVPGTPQVVCRDFGTIGYTKPVPNPGCL